MSREETIAGVDIGTTKVCTVIGQADSRGDINVIGVGVVPSRGMKKGVVVDVQETTKAIRDSVERASHMAGVGVQRVVAGITGEHIQASNRRGTVTVAASRNIVSRSDVERVLQAAALEVPRDRELIHSLPREFILDGQRGVRRPVGMAGQRLEVETHIVTGSSSFLQNVVHCLESCALHVDALVLEPIATAEAVVTLDERELGVVLIDIGGGTSDIAVFMDGTITYSAVIPVGGNHVTRDIAIGLRTPFEIAERLKIERGAASPGMIPHGEALEVVMAGSGERLRIPRALLGEIIEARMSELFEMARASVANAGITRPVGGGVILSGGGALMPGAIDLAQKIFEMPVRLGRPVGLVGWSDQVSTPQFATGVGLCRFAIRQRHGSGLQAEYPTPEFVGGRRIWGAIPQALLTPSEPVVPAHTPAAPWGETPGVAGTPSATGPIDTSLQPREAAQVAASPVPRAPATPAAAATFTEVTAPLCTAPLSPAPPEFQPAEEPTARAAYDATHFGAEGHSISTQPAATGSAPGGSIADVDGPEKAPFDKISRRDQMLREVDEPAWKRIVARIKKLIGFESS